MRVMLAAALVLFGALAGCSEEADEPGAIVLESVDPGGDVQEATSGGEPLTRQTPKSGQRGHLTGFVLDDSLRPVTGAIVALPGLDQTDTTADDGAFAFPDLWPGPYRLTAEAPGHRGADTVVEVPADEFVRVKFVLERVAPPVPRHETRVLAGFAEMAAPYSPLYLPLYLSQFCGTCSYEFDINTENLKTLVIEAFREKGADSVRVGPDYQLYLASMDTGRRLGGCNCDNPARIEVSGEDLGGSSLLYLAVRPFSQLVPEFSVSFQVFVTAFYHEAAPEGWSFVEGGGG